MAVGPRTWISDAGYRSRPSDQEHHVSNTTDCAVGDVITDINLLERLPENTVITTGGGDTRTKTWSGDEWDFVMLGEDLITEGKGSVTVVFLPGK